MAEECAYYYYESGYCCALKREKEGNSSIDSAIVHKYCWGYHYNDCPRYKAKHSGGPGCFLTSACVEAKGLADDCKELTVLRGFRDHYLSNIPNGDNEICEYYHTAPSIVTNIKALPNSNEIFERIYNELVLPCVKLIECGKQEEAHEKYRAYVLELQEQYLHSREEK
ncbi:MAG: hypothetical protein IJX82_05780 [Clostridia bacterium]|nr:hypothetical protein [Clostridia bacterium]